MNRLICEAKILFICKAKSWLILVLIFIFGLFLRHINIQEANIVFDYDQIEDQFYTYKLAVEHDLLIVGRAIYGDPRIHHGVFYYYYNLIPFLLSSGNFFVSVYWNMLFNTATLLIIFLLARSLFNKMLPAISAAFIVASSFQIIKFSSWLTIDTLAIFLVPLTFLGLWFYLKKKNWGLILACFSFGLSLQSDLSFLYLLPVFLIYWLIFRPSVPSFKLLLLTSLCLIIAVSTLILTEIKLDFAGIKTFANFSTIFEEQAKLPVGLRLNLYARDFFINFSHNLLPQKPELGIYLGLTIILTVVYQLFRVTISKQEKQAILFSLLYLFSTAVSLPLLYHDKPWFLIGLPPAIALVTGFAIDKLRSVFLILPVLLIIGASNTVFIVNRPNEAYKLWDSIYDSTSYLAYQLAVVDYTYTQSFGQPFAINAVTYPLYYNGLWAYLYNFYGKSKYGYIPGWLGGDQLHPYDLLPKAKEGEKYLYLLISETSRIPDIYKNIGRSWEKRGEFVEGTTIGGFTVQKRFLQTQ